MRCRATRRARSSSESCARCMSDAADSTAASRWSPAPAAASGAAYARLLGARGASVVVNDLGGSKEGVGADAGPAQIGRRRDRRRRRRGGRRHERRVDRGRRDGDHRRRRSSEFGRVDIVVNNAGIIRWGDLPDVDLDDAAGHPRRAPHRIVQRHPGRVAAHGRAGVRAGRDDHVDRACFGLRGNLAYAAAKAGVVGLMRNMKLSGRRYGITVNLDRTGRCDADGRRRATPIPTPTSPPTWRPNSSPRSSPTCATRTAR